MKSFFSLIGLTTTSVIATVFIAVPSHSALRKIPLTAQTLNHLTIGSVEITDVTNEFHDYTYDYEYNNSVSSWISSPIDSTIDKVDLIVDKVINIGQKIWNVVEKGKPVANYSSSSANALPENATRWNQLENWSAPKSKIITVVYKNVYGMEVIRFTYRIMLLYGGSVGGVGKYIGYANVEPLEMTTAYMYTFNVKASVDSVYNMGTKTNPLAGMILNIQWTVDTVLKKSTMTHTYTLDGLGNINVPSNNSIKITHLK